VRQQQISQRRARHSVLSSRQIHFAVHYIRANYLYVQLVIVYCGCKFFIVSTEFDKNISDGSHDCTDHKNGNDFFMSLMAKNSCQKKPIFLEILETKVIQF